MSLCECGCGAVTGVSPTTDRHHGWVKGEPRRFMPGHNNRLRAIEPVLEDKGHHTPCHIWTGSLNHAGYGRAWGGQAHRVAWERANGPVPEGLELDHLCRVRACVNPDHLEPVSRQENMRRSSIALAAKMAARSAFAATRARLGESRPDTALRLGVSTATIGFWETGRVTPPAQLDVNTLTWTSAYGDSVIPARRDAVLALYRAGESVAAIANQLDVSRGTVTNDVKWWRAFARRELAEHGGPDSRLAFTGRQAA
jgi:DNA-binding XRE family transcriptional regulator